MTEASEGTYNYWRPLFAIINFGFLLYFSLPYMRPNADFWDFVFVGIGGYFGYKFIRYLISASEFKGTRIHPNDMSEFPSKGIYAQIRHPIAAAAIYMNIAYVCLFRSFNLITVVPVFIALWYMVARYEESLMITRFGKEYQEYMKRTSMLRGSGSDQQRLQSSGYDMY
ncbi:MAG: methyltransferase family protein [Candidatus Thorarchaeota archaeon]|jgi:protein-S-isoprenylcysteine O-methyltransferase Ste14